MQVTSGKVRNVTFVGERGKSHLNTPIGDGKGEQLSPEARPRSWPHLPHLGSEVEWLLEHLGDQGGDRRSL